MSIKIQNIISRMILDSRGFPTIESEIYLSDGVQGRACVPSGASTGDKEALELRDGDASWLGKGVSRALSNIEDSLCPQIIGQDPFNIKQIDQTMINIDGTENKANIGANATLAISLATVRAAAASAKQPLFQYISHNLVKNKLKNYVMPTPMMNILNGGSHADNNVDIQEFMIVPIEFSSYSEALKAGTEVFHTLKEILKKQNYNTAIGDEGGFAPNLKENQEAIELILNAIEKAGYNQKIKLALDVAASELYDKTQQSYCLNNREYLSEELIDYYKKLCSNYPIISIEDGLDQNDWQGWIKLNKSLGKKIQIVGDDLTVTNTKLLDKAIKQEAMNSILVKLNQIGTVSETLETIALAQANNFGVIISHRSGETEDTFISDLSVATGAGQIKTGSLCRTDRTAKYNQLLRIEEKIRNNSIYGIK